MKTNTILGKYFNPDAIQSGLLKNVTDLYDSPCFRFAIPDDGYGAEEPCFFYAEIFVDRDMRIQNIERNKDVYLTNYLIDVFPQELEEVFEELLTASISDTQTASYSAFEEIEYRPIKATKVRNVITNGANYTRDLKTKQENMDFVNDWLNSKLEENCYYIPEIVVALRKSENNIAEIMPRIIDRFEVMRNTFAPLQWLDWIAAFVDSILKPYVEQSPLRDYLIEVEPYITQSFIENRFSAQSCRYIMDLMLLLHEIKGQSSSTLY